MKNKLADLTDHLFAQLERLGDESLKEPDAIRAEILRSGAMTGLAREIISAGNLAISAARVMHELGPEAPRPALLGLDNGKRA